MRIHVHAALFGLLIALAACTAHAQGTIDFTVKPQHARLEDSMLTIPTPDYKRPRTTFSTGIPIELGDVSITPRIGLRKAEPSWLIPDDAQEDRRALAVELSYQNSDESPVTGFVAGMLGFPTKDERNRPGFTWNALKVGSIDEAEVQFGFKYRF